MNDPQNGPARLDRALENLRQAAKKVRSCPACGSELIHTTLNAPFTYDHISQVMGLGDLSNLAEHGWHGCKACGHKWVSKALLQSVLPRPTPTQRHGNVIELPNPQKY